MAALNGEQLYGLKRIWATLKMGMNKELKGLSLKQKLALNYVSKESKLTRLGDKIFTKRRRKFYKFTRDLLLNRLEKMNPVIARGSHVEPDRQGRWLADMAPCNGPKLGPFDHRSDALAAETAWLEANWLTPAD